MIGGRASFHISEPSFGSPFQIGGNIGHGGGEILEKISLVEEIVLVKRGETHSN